MCEQSHKKSEKYEKVKFTAAAAPWLTDSGAVTIDEIRIGFDLRPYWRGRFSLMPCCDCCRTMLNTSGFSEGADIARSILTACCANSPQARLEASRLKFSFSGLISIGLDWICWVGGNDDVDCDTRQFGNVDSICCWLGSEGNWKDLSFFIDFLSHDRLLRDRFTLQLEPAKNETAMANC